SIQHVTYMNDFRFLMIGYDRDYDGYYLGLSLDELKKIWHKYLKNPKHQSVLLQILEIASHSKEAKSEDTKIPKEKNKFKTNITLKNPIKVFVYTDPDHPSFHVMIDL
ncbi:MAG: hypothetical protein MUF43_13670, partial [Flavobacterium sp.]|nr:hypothetical protein [Flavobacterium sp.]